MGDQASFSYLLNTYWNNVYLFQLKRTNDEYTAEEVTIKTFSKAFEKIETYNPNFDFKTWLIAISKNTHIDQLRKQKNNLKAATEAEESVMKNTILDEAPTPEDYLIIKQNLEELLFHLKKMKPVYRNIIQLRFFQEKSYKEIAEELNEPINNIKVKLLRAKKLLTESLPKK